MAKRYYSTEDAPYEQSRGALRDRYGTRAIGDAGQSGQDDTLSGRLAMMKGYSSGLKKQMEEARWATIFKNSPTARRYAQEYPQQGPMLPNYGVQGPPKPVVTGGGWSTPGVNPRYVVPGTPIIGAGGQQYSSPFQGPRYEASVPTTLPPSTLSAFMPQSYLPSWRRTNTTSYMGSMLDQASRWLNA